MAQIIVQADNPRDSKPKTTLLQILKDQEQTGKSWIHATISAVLSTLFLYILHHLPLNQIFIDPFSEAIKNHDIMDVAFSRFRKHENPSLFEKDIFIINSEQNDRGLIAEAINILEEKKVAAIGVDLLFDVPKNPQADSLLEAALDTTNIVLGYYFEENRNHTSTSSSRSEPRFLDRVSTGYVNLGSNDGFSIRTFEPFHIVDGVNDTSFAIKLAGIKNPKIIKNLGQRNNTKEWINFRRKQPGKANYTYPVNSESMDHYPVVGITRFLDEKDNYSSDYFKGKIVLIGFMGLDDGDLSMKDRYFTPLNEKYSGRSMPDMHGIVVHANILSMVLSDDFISEISEKYLYLAAFLIFYFNYLLFRRIVKRNLFFTVATVRLIQILQFILLFSLAVYLISAHNIKFSFILVITAVILSFEMYEYYHHRLQKRFESLFFNTPKNA